jgi:IrrE N-terminal-like domain
MAAKEKPKITLDRATHIEELASAVMECRAISSPIDLHQILRDEGITFSYGDYGDAFDGLIEWKNHRFHIYSNTARGNLMGSPRARFTVGHELGHYFIDEHRKLLKVGKISLPLSGHEATTADLIIEREANLFAASLLAPRTEFIRAARKAPEGLSGIVSLATQFHVSVLCAAIRAVSLETESLVLSFWTDEGLRWKWVSRRWFAAGFRKMKEDFGQLGNDFAIKRALADSPEGASVHRNGSVAAFWFHAHTMGSHEDFDILEEAVRLGQFGVISILRPLNGNARAKLQALAQEHTDGDF